jgi:hypothetical protein
MVGLRNHRQARPVTMKDIDSGYRKTVRNAPSNRTFWSISTASSVPKASAPTMNSPPNTNMLLKAVCQRAVPNRRTYCPIPAKL